jgi:hypothetical protein
VIHDAGNETIGRRVVEYLAPDEKDIRCFVANNSLVSFLFVKRLQPLFSSSLENGNCGKSTEAF